MIKFFRKYHKWLGVIFALIILSYVFSGIVLNHRETLSFIDVNGKLLPKEYRYQNWNNAAVKSTLKISPDGILGVTVFEKIDSYKYLVGSFEGLFTRNSQRGEVFDYVKKELYTAPSHNSRPIGDFLVSGFTRDFKNQEYYFDYDQGAVNING